MVLLGCCFVFGSNFGELVQCYEMTERDLKIVAGSAKRRIGRPLSEDERSELAICWLKRARKTESVATCNWQSVGDFIVDKMREREREEKTKAAAVIHRDTLRADRCMVAAIGRRYGVDGLETLRYRNMLPHLQDGQRMPPTFVHPSDLDDSDPFGELDDEVLRRLVCALGEGLQWELMGLGERSVAATADADVE
jgi:hypothetical protein